MKTITMIILSLLLVYRCDDAPHEKIDREKDVIEVNEDTKVQGNKEIVETDIGDVVYE